MKFSDFKRNVIMEIGEWSANGNLTSATANRDYILSMTDFTNRELTTIVTATKSKMLTTKIIQDNPVNLLGQKFTEYKLEGGEEIFSVDNAKGYSLMVGGTCVIYIEEYNYPDWEIRSQIDHSQAEGGGYTLYKGEFENVYEEGVRIRITSDYDIPFKWVALFLENREFKVSYQPYIEYSLPNDLYLFQSISRQADNGEYEELAPHRYQISGKKLYLPYEEKGEFKIEYVAYPTLLTYDQDNDTIADDEELDILDEYIPSLIYAVAGKLKANVDKKYAIGDRYSAISIDNTNATLQNKQKRSVETPFKRR